MFIDFKQIDDLLEQHDEYDHGIKKSPNRWRDFSFWEQFFYCQCGHIYYNHRFDNEHCDVDKCGCTKIVFVDASLEITFTIADLFEEENLDHSETDSPQWWIEFKFWLESRK